MKKSSLKNYITLLEAAADSATHARDYWMREHERRDEELLEAKHRITLLEEDNERLRRHFADCTEHNHPFERDNNDTQA